MPMHDYGQPPPGYQLPDGTAIGRVVLQVADLDRSVAYYTDVIGLRTLARHPDGALLGAAPDGPPLIELRGRPGARPVPPRGRLGLFHVAILVPDRPALAGVLAHLLAIGVEPAMSDHFVSEALYLWDPDGLGLEIYSDRPRNLWRSAGRQLYMTTEPLDVRHLLAERGTDRTDRPERNDWTGLPAGTSVGHVHLSVDDLDRASAFYHAALGFDLTVWSYPGALFAAAGGYHHHVGLNTWSRRAPLATADDARLVEWEIVLPTRADVADAGRAMAAQAGVDVVTQPPDAWRVVDPWGIGVICRPQPDAPRAASRRAPAD